MCAICKTKHIKYMPCPGPPYPTLPGLEKYRQIATPTKAERLEHGEAVHRAVQALQRQELLGRAQRSEAKTRPYVYKWRADWARLGRFDDYASFRKCLTR